MIALRDNFGTDPDDLPARVRQVFAPDGLMSKARNFEYRAEQQRLAVLAAQALTQGRHLVVEAGTGVGKSLGYLVPAVLHAVETGQKAVVSTHTINLQEQLIFKDIPILQKLLPIEFEAALFKGRQNYLCPRRLARARQQSQELFTGPEQTELERIALWSQKTRDGTLSDLPREPAPGVWSQVCSEAHLCTPKSCGPESGCFYQAARRRAAAASLVVLNHALFFTLFAATLAGDEEGAGGTGADPTGPGADRERERPRGYLFDDDFVVFDEAHTIEAVAARQLGLSVSQYGLRATLLRLYNPRTRKGLWTVLRHGEGVRRTGELLDGLDRFFAQLDQAANFRGGGREARVRDSGLVPNSLADPLEALGQTLAETARQLDDEPTRAELLDVARRVHRTADGLTTFLDQSAPDNVYWVERTGKTEGFLSLNAAPVNLAEVLGPLLFRPERSVLMTSATLSVGQSELGYFRNRLGAWGDTVDAAQIGSPFDFARQMKLHVSGRVPEARLPGYEETLCREIGRYLDLTRGRAFVLFTNHRLMQAAAARMRPEFFAARGWRLLVQGEGTSRRQLLDDFKANTETSVLFGAESFWSGVDVPGEALSNVIITQLPFTPPDSPATEARCELIKSQGGDPFLEYSLPEAILRFRQGVGRLIRTRQDQGIVVVLDSRVLTKPYGRAFLSALPKCPVEVDR